MRVAEELGLLCAQIGGSRPRTGFLDALNVERVRHRAHATCDEARRDLVACVESFWKSRRLHSGTGFRSSAGMERKAA